MFFISCIWLGFTRLSIRFLKDWVSCSMFIVRDFFLAGVVSVFSPLFSGPMLWFVRGCFPGIPSHRLWICTFMTWPGNMILGTCLVLMVWWTCKFHDLVQKCGRRYSSVHNGPDWHYQAQPRPGCQSNESLFLYQRSPRYLGSWIVQDIEGCCWCDRVMIHVVLAFVLCVPRWLLSMKERG